MIGVPAGRLRQRVRIMRDLVHLEGGQSLDTAVAVAEVWAEVVPLTGQELIRVRQSLPEVTHRVKLHWRRDLRASDWVEHDGRRLAIVSLVNVEELNRWYEAFCVEQTQEVGDGI